MNEYQVTIKQGETVSEHTVFAWSKRQALFYISNDKMFDGKSGVKRKKVEPTEHEIDPNEYSPANALSDKSNSDRVMPGYECD